LRFLTVERRVSLIILNGNRGVPGRLKFNLPLTLPQALAFTIPRMSQDPLQIEDRCGSADGIRILRLSGPLVLANVFGFQSMVRADDSRALILDFEHVPLVDSAGIGALIGAYVNRLKGGRSLGLVGVNQRIHHALEVTRVDGFLSFYKTIAEAERAAQRGNQSEAAAS
jgi:anti-anti-sigma factor